MSKPTYLVACDLSLNSHVAAKVAARIAARTDARLELVCVSPDAAGEERAAFEQRIRELLEGIARESAPDVGEHGLHVLLDQDPPTALADLARELRARMIVVAPRSHSRWRGTVLGGNTERVVRRARGDVLVARDLGRPIGKVMIAADDSPSGRRSLERGLELARSLGASVEVVHVAAEPGLLRRIEEGLGSNVYREDKGRLARGRKMVEEWLAAADTDGLEVETVVRMGDAAEELLEQAESSEPDLIVMGTHARPAPVELFVGSVSRSVATGAAASVLLVRGRAKDDLTPRAR